MLGSVSNEELLAIDDNLLYRLVTHGRTGKERERCFRIHMHKMSMHLKSKESEIYRLKSRMSDMGIYCYNGDTKVVDIYSHIVFDNCKLDLIIVVPECKYICKSTLYAVDQHFGELLSFVNMFKKIPINLTIGIIYTSSVHILNMYNKLLRFEQWDAHGDIENDNVTNELKILLGITKIQHINNSLLMCKLLYYEVTSVPDGKDLSDGWKVEIQ